MCATAAAARGDEDEPEYFLLFCPGPISMRGKYRTCYGG